MHVTRVLVANRGEIAVRICRSAARLGVESVAVHSSDDATSPHVRHADMIRQLPGRGAAAYLDAEQLVAVAVESGCDALHPGYGFLAERAELASRCAAAGVLFVGPEPATLDLLGDKTAARQLARDAGVPVLEGSAGPTSVEEAERLLGSLGPTGAVMLKARAGGGGRGMRVVTQREHLRAAFDRCSSEALGAFGDGSLYVEQYVSAARHVEVQLAADAHGEVMHLGDRECSIQRRHQKLVEMAPAPGLDPGLRARLHDAAVRIGLAAHYGNLGTIEFLVDVASGSFAFIEANARLQVEHTVTEAVTGLDLVAVQFRLAEGAALRELGLDPTSPPSTRGAAVQMRINTETIGVDGTVRATGGTITTFDPPTGPGVRVDSYAVSGMTTNPAFDSLLAKVIVHDDDHVLACAGASRALRELRVDGVETNVALLRALLSRPEVSTGAATTTFLDDHLAELLDEALALADAAALAEVGRVGVRTPGAGLSEMRAGAPVDRNDPLAVLTHGKVAPGRRTAQHGDGDGVDEGDVSVRAPMQGTVISVEVSPGDVVHADQLVAVLEAMKMEHVITAGAGGIVTSVRVSAGDTVYEDHTLVTVQITDVEATLADDHVDVDLAEIRPDLAEAIERHRVGLDEARPEAVAKRRATGQRTARENLADLVDAGSYIEYGALAIAAQRRRRSVDDLIARTPADGLVAGIGRVNGQHFGDEASRCVVLSYDYTVLAGTQGQQNHRKKDRLFELAEQWHIPVVLFTEGGGGRPGDTDGLGVAGLDCWAFYDLARLSGLVPIVGINSGRCFAGNAALLGCCDVVIATQDSSIGMGGPAMIEGGGLGVYHPDEVGPMAVQTANGVVDLAVPDEAAAVRAAKQYLAYFQGPLAEWKCADQRLLRRAVPDNRLRVYDVRRVIDLVFDTDSVLELRSTFGPGMITALARMEGRPVGVIANNPTHLAGAIDADGADKAARFMQLCDAFDLPIVSLCDTPGMMVGPETEKTALVRHCSRLFVTGANLTVPMAVIVLRKGYGLGAQAMAGGSFKAPFFTVAWPTGEFGGMGLEGAVKLGYRKELAAIADAEERRAEFDVMVARMYEHGKAVNMASHFEIDDVIDPADSRHWISTMLRSVPAPQGRTAKKRPNVDTW
jgi:acetyl/propionyl-CoA carboxylase alpha subunit/acetyl-CoA carboxylase carboxyltransferase component